MITSVIERRIQESVLHRWLLSRKLRSRRRKFCKSVNQHLAARRLLVDLSVIAQRDAGTGIQRLVRSVSKALMESSDGLQIVPVMATGKWPYHAISWPYKGDRPRDVLDVGPGDVFLGLDLSLDSIWRYRRQIELFKTRGMVAWFVVYDMLPHRRPDWFTDGLVVRYRKWLNVITSLADGFFCISHVVAKELREWLTNDCSIPKENMPRIELLPIGWDILEAPYSLGVRRVISRLVETMIDQPTVLMVGTLEPRKGYKDVLAAFEILWQQNNDLMLVIVGRPGWKTDGLQHALRMHPQANKKIFWIADATDEEVSQLYRSCTGLIAASYDEGLGLPIIEILGYSKPVLARDIEVFHTIESPLVTYFPHKATPCELAEAIASWIHTTHCVQGVKKHILPSWRDTAVFIRSTLH